MEESNPIYARDTIEFVTVALEFCSFVEKAGEKGVFDFVDKATKLLPLLYLKAALLPQIEDEEESDTEQFVTEEMYETVRNRIARLLGEKDTYLETFHPDMPFIFLFRQENETLMREAVASCSRNFREYWGQQALNALKALHAVRYGDDDFGETNQEEEEA